MVSDLICPWCYIGKRQLERALELLAAEGLTFSVHWNPFQINPSMPKEGRETQGIQHLEIRLRRGRRRGGLPGHPGRRQSGPDVADRPCNAHAKHARGASADLVRRLEERAGCHGGNPVQGVLSPKGATSATMRSWGIARRRLGCLATEAWLSSRPTLPRPKHSCRGSVGARARHEKRADVLPGPPDAVHQADPAGHHGRTPAARPEHTANMRKGSANSSAP